MIFSLFCFGFIISKIDTEFVMDINVSGILLLESKAMGCAGEKSELDS